MVKLEVCHGWCNGVDGAHINAPPKVRRWLEQELLAAFGLRRPIAGAQAPQLAACSVEESSAVVSLIQGMLPGGERVESGREGLRVEGEDLTAFDILRHTRLQTVEQVIACLDTISAAVRRDASAVYGLDSARHRFISAQTQRTVVRIWQQLITARNLHASTVDGSGASCAEPGMRPVERSAVAELSSPISAPGAPVNSADRSTPPIAPASISP